MKRRLAKQSCVKPGSNSYIEAQLDIGIEEILSLLKYKMSELKSDETDNDSGDNSSDTDDSMPPLVFRPHCSFSDDDDSSGDSSSNKNENESIKSQSTSTSDSSSIKSDISLSSMASVAAGFIRIVNKDPPGKVYSQEERTAHVNMVKAQVVLQEVLQEAAAATDPV